MAPFVTKVYDGGTIYHGVSNLHLQFAFAKIAEKIFEIFLKFFSGRAA